MKVNMNVLDLTYKIEVGMPTFGAHWHSKVKINQLGKIDIEGRETREIVIGTHTGTHIDAPLHFFKSGESIDQIGLEKLMGKIDILDFSYLKAGECVSRQMLEKLEIKNEKVILKFDWGKYWSSERFFCEYPYLTVDAAEYLIERKVSLIGMDTPSPDDSRIQFGSEKDSQIHKLFLKNKVILIEYLANLSDIGNDCKGWSIVAMPLNIKGADGSPARVLIYKD